MARDKEHLAPFHKGIGLAESIKSRVSRGAVVNLAEVEKIANDNAMTTPALLGFIQASGCLVDYKNGLIRCHTH